MAEVTPAERAATVNKFREGKSTGKELIGKPVISLDNGERLGEIHDVVYSPREGKLIGFTIPRGGGLFSRGDTLWLSADSIYALGEDAVTIQSADVFQAYQDSADEVAEQAGESVLGKRLMTDDGKFLGAIDDVLIERESRRVVAYEVSGGIVQDMMKGQTDVPVDHIISIGKDVVIVPAFVRDHIAQASGGLAAVASSAQEKATELKDTTAEKIAQARTETAEAIEAREIEYALGKVAGSSVYLDDKETAPLIREGETITQAHIDQAVPAGRMHALAAAAGKAQAGDAAQAARERISAATASVKEKAGDLGAAAKDRYGETLVGRTTGRAVLSDSGVPLVPADHVITEADVEAAKAAGKLDALTAAVGAAAWESTQERIGDAYTGAKEQVGAAYDAARERSAAERAAADAERAAAAANTAERRTSASSVEPTIVIENPEQVVVQVPAAKPLQK